MHRTNSRAHDAPDHAKKLPAASHSEEMLKAASRHVAPVFWFRRRRITQTRCRNLEKRVGAAVQGHTYLRELGSIVPNDVGVMSREIASARRKASLREISTSKTEASRKKAPPKRG